MFILLQSALDCRLLRDRTNGHAIGTVLRLSVAAKEVINIIYYVFGRRRRRL